MSIVFNYEECGLEWVFTYHADTGLAYVENQIQYACPVIEGKALHIPMNQKSADWLQTTWQEAVGEARHNALYCGLETEFVRGRKSCCLTNDYCPLCLKQKDAFDVHHCVFTALGGTDDVENLLEICSTCHAILHSRNVEDAEPKAKAACYHQIIYFGLDYFPRHNATRKGQENRNYFKTWPNMKILQDYMYHPDTSIQDRVNDILKQDARLKYQYFRDMGLGKWPWHDFEEYKQDFD